MVFVQPFHLKSSSGLIKTCLLISLEIKFKNALNYLMPKLSLWWPLYRFVLNLGLCMNGCFLELCSVSRVVCHMVYLALFVGNNHMETSFAVEKVILDT